MSLTFERRSLAEGFLELQGHHERLGNRMLEIWFLILHGTILLTADNAIMMLDTTQMCL